MTYNALKTSSFLNAVDTLSEKTAYIIFADGEYDEVVETEAQAKKACKWLRDHGMKATVRKCPWLDQDDVIEASYK